MIPPLLIAALLLPLLGGAFCALPPGRSRPVALAVAVTFLGAAFGLVAMATPEPVLLAAGSAPADLGPVLLLDRTGALLLALVAAVTLAATAQTPHGGAAPILLAAGGLAGAILAADLFTLLLFLQLAAAAIAGAIGTLRPAAAMRYLIPQIASGLLLVFGAALLYSETGTLGIGALRTALAARPEGDASLLRLGGALVVTGLATRAGLAPVHLWLPAGAAGAMTALTAGVNAALVLRLMPLFDAPPLTGIVPWLAPLGLVTAVCGLAGVALARDAGRQAGHAVLGVTGLALAATSGTAPALVAMLAGVPAVAVLFLVSGTGGPGRLLPGGVAGVALLAFPLAAALTLQGIAGGVLIGASLAAAAGLIRTARAETGARGWPIGATGLAGGLLLLAALSGPIGRHLAITQPAQHAEGS